MSLGRAWSPSPQSPASQQGTASKPAKKHSRKGALVKASLQSLQKSTPGKGRCIRACLQGLRKSTPRKGPCIRACLQGLRKSTPGQGPCIRARPWSCRNRRKLTPALAAAARFLPFQCLFRKRFSRAAWAHQGPASAPASVHPSHDRKTRLQPRRWLAPRTNTRARTPACDLPLQNTPCARRRRNADQPSTSVLGDISPPRAAVAQSATTVEAPAFRPGKRSPEKRGLQARDHPCAAATKPRSMRPRTRARASEPALGCIDI